MGCWQDLEASSSVVQMISHDCVADLFHPHSAGLGVAGASVIDCPIHIQPDMPLSWCVCTRDLRGPKFQARTRPAPHRLGPHPHRTALHCPAGARTSTATLFLRPAPHRTAHIAHQARIGPHLSYDRPAAARTCSMQD